MIELRDKDKNRVAGLVDYENLCIESILESGDKTLSFYYPKKGKYYDEIVEEAYIKTKKDEFVVKARELDEDYTKFECSLNLEELEGNIFDRFESVEQTITSALNLAVVGTGWTVKDNTLKKRRTVRCTNKSSLEIVREIKKVYRVDIVFNTLGKQIEVYEHLGEDKGTYFIDSLNLIALQVQSDSRQYATRIIAEGKDGLSFSDINNGKNYVENYQYSNKVKTIYWKDERYSVKENLLEDARAKLEELSKPFRSYSASILNLAELNPRYSSILDFKLGDAINLISKKNKIKDKQRIVKTIEWPQDHTKDSVELANATLKFEDIQQENQETTDTVNNITTDNGTVDGSTIDSITTKQIEDFEANVIKVAKLKAILAEIENLHVNKADIQNLNAVIARIGTLEATKASITELNAIHAIIQQIKAGKADIADLNAAVAKVGILENKTAVLENALAGNLTAENFKANSITATSGIIAEGAIGSAQISSLSLNKLEAGDITTSKHRIVSADGTIEIVGNQILINRNNVNRVILGEYRKQDNTTEYGLLIRGKDGRTVMFDSDGVHNAGITDGAIDNNKVADNANISGNKLDINSVIREVNNNGTETIKGTKVTVGDRTLDVELSTQNNTITEHSKELSSQKTSINALDNALKLKVDEQVYRDSINTINDNISNTNSNLSKATTELNLLKGEVGSKVNKTDIDKTVKEIEDKIKINTDKISTAESSFIQKTNEIKANVSNLESETTTKIINAKNEAIKESRSIPDTRNDNQPPSWYMKTYPNQTITEFKYSDIVQILGSKVFGTLETKVPWDNSSGGYPTQIFRSNSTATFQRHGISETDWSDWEQIENTKGSQEKANGALENSKDYTNSQITVVNTKVYNLESGIDILKDQIKSKVSQSDIDKSITTVDNKIKLVDSKISDVSSSVIQLKDSVETSINSINSKTQSLETSLNGKVSKQELTVVDNKVANIKASLDGITQRVSSTESKTQTLEININGKASKEEIVSINSKVASIETSLSGITNRVSSTESKTSSLEVSINSTNSELNILKNSISTKLEKIDSHIKYGSTNLLINTEFLNNFYNWNKNQYVGLDKYQEKDYVGVMIQNNRIGTEGTLWQRATLKTEVTYTLSFEEYTDDISRWWVGIYYKLNGATKYITLFDSSVNKHSWQKRVFQFKLPSGATETDVSFYNYGGSVGRVWVCNLQLEEGEFATPYKSNPLDFSKFSSAITQTVEGINTEVSKKVNGRDIISTINQSAESVKINASRINLQGYVTVGDLGSTNVTTINNAHITSGTIEGRTMIALNGTGKQNGVLTVNNGESYLEYFRCREAWMMSPYANGWRVPLVHSKYGIKDNESSSDMIDEIAFYRGTDGRNYLQITNTKTGRVEYIELYRSAFDTVTILNRLDRIDAKLAGL